MHLSNWRLQSDCDVRRIAAYFWLRIALTRHSPCLMIGPRIIAGPCFGIVSRYLAKGLCCAFSGGETERSSYSEHNGDREGWSVSWRQKVFVPLQHKSAPQRKAVSEKDVSSWQYKAASHNFRFHVLWAC